MDLAYLEWRDKQLVSARDHFGKAFALGDRNPKMLWDYGRMAAGAEPSKAAEALAELLKQAPDRLEVRLELASVELNSHHAKEALETLAPVKKVTPADAPRLLMLLTYANLSAGDRVTARNAADQWKKVAATQEDRDRADRVLQSIENSRSEAVNVPAPAIGENDVAPRLAHRDTKPEPEHATVRRPSVAGKFVELRCGTSTALVIETDNGRKMFRIDDPSKLVVNGTSQTMELTCGLQKPVPVRVEFDPADSSSPASIEGVARALHFNP